MTTETEKKNYGGEILMLSATVELFLLFLAPAQRTAPTLSLATCPTLIIRFIQMYVAKALSRPRCF